MHETFFITPLCDVQNIKIFSDFIIHTKYYVHICKRILKQQLLNWLLVMSIFDVKTYTVASC